MKRLIWKSDRILLWHSLCYKPYGMAFAGSDISNTKENKGIKTSGTAQGLQ